MVAAKAQASSGAGVVAAIAHQLHGAIGTTEEHRLRLTTTRLWSWRDEDGSGGRMLRRARPGGARRRRWGSGWAGGLALAQRKPGRGNRYLMRAQKRLRKPS